jgi:enoyl-[acyl-carrier protein] reductase/trans-2-enoyl-CoA reductase (NAD+)
MGGEDWERWIDQWHAAGILPESRQICASSYIGAEVTWPIYAHGTIDRSQDHLERSAKNAQKKLEKLQGMVVISVHKAL